MALSDSSGSVQVSYRLGEGLPTVVPGDVLCLSGHVTKRDSQFWSSAAEVKTATLLRHGPAPQPLPTNIAAVVSGILDWRLTRIEGLLREAVRSDTNAQWMHLTISDNGSLLHASLPLDNNVPADFYDLIGAHIAVTGICSPQDRSNKLYQGRIFHCCGKDAVQIIKPRPANLFESPAIDKLRYRQPSEIATLGAHLASGRVLAVWRNNNVLLRAASGESIHLVVSSETPLPALGESIDAAGFPESSLFNLRLSHAVWRKRDAVDIPAERTCQLLSKHTQADRTPLHGRVVVVDGIVLRLPQKDISNDFLIIENNGKPVNLDVSALSGLPPDVVSGCRLRTTGIYLIEPDLRASSFLLPRITGSFVIVRTPADLVVLAAPKWWTPQRLFALVAALVIGLIILIVWVSLLRRLAEKRGQALAAETIAHAETDLKVLERTRLAVDLHDVIAQNLTGIALELETAKRLSSDSRPELQQHLTVAAQSLRSCRQELRNCLWDLRSHALEEPDMDAAIRHTLPLHLKEVRFVLRFNVPRANFTDNSTHTILCVIRELAHNAVQHGKATVVKIAGCIENGQLLFSVQDNGCGFDPDTCPDGAQGHFGLEGIRERIRPMHGTLTISSTAGKGTRAVVTIPLRNPNPS